MKMIYEPPGEAPVPMTGGFRRLHPPYINPSIPMTLSRRSFLATSAALGLASTLRAEVAKPKKLDPKKN